MKAYKCNKCKKFFDGNPKNSFKVQNGKWNDSWPVVIPVDLCKPCRKEFDKAYEID